MVGTILLIITEGYDDMAYLSSQVILEEAGNDVISTSPSGGALKGETSSVMTVTLEEAMSQDIDYLALVLVGGNQISSIAKLPELVNEFLSSGKIVAAFDSGVTFLSSMDLNIDLSTDSSIVHADNVLSMKSPDDCENFVEKLVELIE